MLEAMLYGCVSAVSTRVQEHRWSPLSQFDVTWGLPPSPEGIAERLNELMADVRLQRRIAYRAMEFVREYSDARIHAETILDHLENREAYGHVPGIYNPGFWDDICDDAVPEVRMVERQDEFVSNNLPATIAAVAAPVEEDEEEELAPAPAELLSTLGIPARLNGTTDSRWIKFISGVARAWLEAFG
jgi:hypothetical protein